MNSETIKCLNAEFEEDKIRKMERLDSNGMKYELSYIPAKNIIQRLNECFSNDWCFTIVDKFVDLSISQVAVHGRLEVVSDSGTIVKEQWGGAYIEKTINGKVINLGDNLKAASTDSLKKCASLLGVGLYMYTDDVKEKVGEVEQAELESLKASMGSIPGAETKKHPGCSEKQAQGIRTMLEGMKIDEANFIKVLNVGRIEDLSELDAGRILTLKHRVWGRIPKSGPVEVSRT